MYSKIIIKITKSISNSVDSTKILVHPKKHVYRLGGFLNWLAHLYLISIEFILPCQYCTIETRDHCSNLNIVWFAMGYQRTTICVKFVSCCNLFSFLVTCAFMLFQFCTMCRRAMVVENLIRFLKFILFHSLPPRNYL